MTDPERWTEHPSIVAEDSPLIAQALKSGGVVALPAVGGYVLAVRAGSPEHEARLVDLAADPEGPHYAVGNADAVRQLTSSWSEELATLLERCWPGPMEVFVAGTDTDRSGPWAVIVGTPVGRALRRLCREVGPWRTVPLSFPDATATAQVFSAADVACVVEGGLRDGPPATVVDATVSPLRVLREGVLPASFIEGTMLMSARRRWLSRSRRKAR